MAAPKKSVDEIWRELNARSAPRASSIGAAVGGALPGVTSRARLLPKAQGAEALAAAEALSLVEESRRRTATYDPARAGVSAEELQAFMAGIQRTVNCLSDPDRAARRQAAQALHARLAAGDASPALLQALLCGPLLYPLVALLSDSMEACRSRSLHILADGAAAIADVAPLLPALLPELARRFGQLPVQEGSEEIRLQIVGLLGALLAKMGARAAAGAADSLALVACRALEDPFHEIKKVAAGCLVALAPLAGPEALEPHAEKLLAALAANLGHPHSRVRRVPRAPLPSPPPPRLLPAAATGC